MQALAGLVHQCGQCRKSNRGVHEVAQNGPADGGVALEVRIDRLCKESLTEARVALCARLNCLLEIPRERHITSELWLALPIVGPMVFRLVNRLLLMLLCAAAQEDDDRFAIL